MLFDLQGLDTVALPSAGEALEYAEAEPIDLLIVDYHLDDDVTGIEVTLSFMGRTLGIDSY